MITTHVLDTSRGIAAADVGVSLDVRNGDGWRLVARGATDANGRLTLTADDPIAPGTYRLTFETAAYHRTVGIDAPFFPEAQVVFMAAGSGHYHVPLLLSPFAYTTYRGA